MVESHGSVSEIREMARLIRNGSLDEAIGAKPYDAEDDESLTLVGGMNIPDDVKRDAILVEALNCLADKKEAERGR